MTACSSDTRRLAPDDSDHRVARLAAVALVLAVLDAGLPSPLPGVKPGLANIVTLIALYRYGLGAAVWVSGLRIVGAGLLFGSLMTPGFLLSLAGGLASLAGLAAAHRLPARGFGPVTASLVAAFCHIGGQLALARLILIPSDGILYFVPAFALAALVTGTVNGVLAAKLLEPDHETD
ncbi:Gx transporter family protein [Crenobacter luteus]|uniref:Heptaprenyl diphosphate synthase n=1 Tax=Crenobacter luteus TaxID=1452487 RepID=A0A165F6I7_9NEIS|nr:Gx transporter family protein [Crenobacter luteus]KZE31709.1 heptaprenyl diphosphate synthase [Crenobacter luteus]